MYHRLLPVIWDGNFHFPRRQNYTEGNSCPPSSVAETESWQKGCTANSQEQLRHYQSYRSDRPEKVGGGCLLYVHDQQVATDFDHYKYRNHNVVVWYAKSCYTIFAVVYRSPGAETLGCKGLLDKYRQAIRKYGGSWYLHSKRLQLYPDIDWEHGNMSGDTGSQGQDLMEFLIDTSSPRLWINQQEEVTFTNVPRYVSEVTVNPTPMSDHNLVDVQLQND